MELEALDFHEKVAEGYRKLAQRDPKRIYTIDATLPVDAIHEMIVEKVEAIFGK